MPPGRGRILDPIPAAPDGAPDTPEVLVRLIAVVTVLCATALPVSLSVAGSRTESHHSTDHEKHEDRYQIGAKPGQLLEIELDTGAGLGIIGWDRKEVVVETHWRESKCPDARVDVVTTDRGIRVTSKYAPDTGDIHNCSMQIEIHVPKKFDVVVRSSGGGIELVDVRGVFQGHTGGGDLRLDKVRGKVELTTGGGEIEVKDSDLDGKVETGGGHVSFDNVSGPVRASSGSEPGIKRGKTRSQ
jgi:hypothetical protein